MSEARTVVVTGALGGMGSEIVDRFLASGDTVVASDISQERLDTWRARWDSGGQNPSLHAFPADISSEDSVAALAEATRQRVGTVDVLMNNAGSFPQTAFEEMTTKEWRQVIDVDLTGTYLMIRAYVPLMKASSRGRIVNIGSGPVFFLAAAAAFITGQTLAAVGDRRLRAGARRAAAWRRISG